MVSPIKSFTSDGEHSMRKIPTHSPWLSHLKPALSALSLVAAMSCAAVVCEDDALSPLSSRLGLGLPSLSLPSSVFAAETDEPTDELSDDTSREYLWPGFLTGLRGGFEEAPRPIGSPLYFEDPYINSDLRPLLLYHEFPKDSLLGGGDLTALAVQARLALLERLQFIATADGHTDLEAVAIPEGEGYNDVALGLKGAVYVDPETLSIVSTGMRWRLSNGSRDVFQGTEDELSFFVTGARAFGKLHVMADIVGRVTTHHERGNDSLSWDVNVSYEVFEGFFPMVEYHGFVYLSNGSRFPVRDGLLDYGNLGASDVRGSSAHWATLGVRWNFVKHVSFGFGYGFSLRREANNDIFKRRITSNLIFTF